MCQRQLRGTRSRWNPTNAALTMQHKQQITLTLYAVTSTANEELHVNTDIVDLRVQANASMPASSKIHY